MGSKLKRARFLSSSDEPQHSKIFAFCGRHLPAATMYSIMLYMKTRVTFRVAPDLADVLRQLPNQTSFVETALREALRAKCPTCGGTGRVTRMAPRVSNFRR